MYDFCHDGYFKMLHSNLIDFVYSCMLQSNLLLLFFYFDIYMITGSLIMFTVFHL